MAATKSLKEGKTPGQHHGLDAEHFIADTDIAAEVLQLFIEPTWDEKQQQDDWSEDIIVKITKKALC